MSTATTYMLQLPVATGLDGSESAWVVQGGDDKRTTTAEIAGLASSGEGSTAAFVFAADQTVLFPGSRILTPEAGVTTVTDNGAGQPIVVGVETNGIDNTKLAQMTAGTVKANITGAPANATDVTIAALLAALYDPVVVSAAGVYNVPVGATCIVINKTDGANVVMPAISSKVGPVTIIAAQGASHPFNLVLTDGTFIGVLSAYPFTDNYQSVTFLPISPLTTYAVA